MPETPAYEAYVRQSPERILEEASELFMQFACAIWRMCRI
jgi:hypothetical protein